MLHNPQKPPQQAKLTLLDAILLAAGNNLQCVPQGDASKAIRPNQLLLWCCGASHSWRRSYQEMQQNPSCPRCKPRFALPRRNRKRLENVLICPPESR